MQIHSVGVDLSDDLSHRGLNVTGKMVLRKKFTQKQIIVV